MNLKNIQQNIKRNKNISMYITLFCVIAGYVFFFASPYILPGSSAVDATPLNTEIPCQDGNTIRMLRSEYSVTENKMQYEFDVQGDLLRPYEFVIKFRTRSGKVTQLPVTPVYQEADIYVINIYNVIEKWTEIQVEIFGYVNNEQIRAAIVYTDRGSVTYKEPILDKSAAEYRIDKAYLHINEYREEINNLKIENDSKWYEIGLLRNLNEQLESRKAYETASEQASTDNIIKTNINSISSYYEEILTNEAEIKEYEQKILKANELIQELSQ